MSKPCNDCETDCTQCGRPRVLIDGESMEARLAERKQIDLELLAGMREFAEGLDEIVTRFEMAVAKFQTALPMQVHVHPQEKK